MPRLSKQPKSKISWKKKGTDINILHRQFRILIKLNWTFNNTKKFKKIELDSKENYRRLKCLILENISEKIRTYFKLYIKKILKARRHRWIPRHKQNKYKIWTDKNE